eukprot:3283702-Prymnesium_polylepis.1
MTAPVAAPQERTESCIVAAIDAQQPLGLPPAPTVQHAKGCQVRRVLKSHRCNACAYVCGSIFRSPDLTHSLVH